MGSYPLNIEYAVCRSFVAPQLKYKINHALLLFPQPLGEQIMRRIRSLLLLLFGMLGLATPVSATPILHLNGASCHNQIECSLQLSGNGATGIAATFSSPDVSIGRSDFFAFADGMIFGSHVFPHAFDLTFNRTVRWNGGTLGLAHRFDGFTIAGAGVSASDILAGQGIGTFSLATPITFLADENYRFDGNPSPHFSIAILGDMQFAPIVTSASPSIVPLPGTLPMMALLITCLAWLGLRRQNNQGSEHWNRRANHAVA